MAWYNDPARQTYVGTYKSEALMRSDVEAAAKFGFVTRGIDRSGQQWTVAFHRDEQAWARIKADTAAANLERERNKLMQAKADVDTKFQRLTTTYRSAHTLTSSPVQLEKDLLKSISALLTARNTANVQRQVVLGAITALQTADSEAEKITGKTEGRHNTLDSEIQSIRDGMQADTNRIQLEQPTPGLQQGVVNAVQTWQQVVSDRWAAYEARARDLTADTPPASGTSAIQATLARVTTSLSALELSARERWTSLLSNRRASEAAPTTDTPIPESVPAIRQDARATRQARLEALETQLERSEADLLRKLQIRDQQMAQLLL